MGGTNAQGIRPLRPVAAFLMLVLGMSSFSQAKSCLEYMTFGKAKYGDYAPNAKGTFTKDDRILIDKIEQAHPELTAEKWTEIGKIYFAARVRNVPEVGHQFLLKKWKNLEPTYNNKGILIANSGGISVPMGLERTPLGVIMQAHEFEHAIQIWAPYLVPVSENVVGRALKAASLYLNEKTINVHDYLNPLFLYQNEKSAMEAEWEIASTISLEASVDIIRIVNAMYIRQEVKEFLKYIVVLGTYSKEDYIKAQHLVDRYSFKSSVKATVPYWLSVVKFAGVCSLTLLVGH